MDWLRAAWLGFSAAWDSLRWIETGGVAELADGFGGEEDPLGPTGALADRADRAAFLALRLLARFPRSPWRATCLFRSVASCLVRRRLGLPARLALGVRPDPCGGAAPAAHAWTEGTEEREERPEGATGEPEPATREPTGGGERPPPGGWSRLVRPGGR